MAVKEIERLVVVVDIRAWLLHPNPTKLALLLQQSVHTFLASMSPSCRWGFKLFDSSLSPFSSHCKINKLLGSWACSTRFDSVLLGGDNSPTLPEVLSQFCSALNCLHTELHKNLAPSASAANGNSVAAANAGFIASSLLELLADCTWNPLLPSHEDAATTSQYDHLLAPIQFNSNLVIFFSTLPSTHTELVHFLGHESVAPVPDLLTTFTSSFKKVRESFSANNIHLCWVDVPVSISTLDHDKEIICNGGAFHKSPLSSLLDHVGWSFTSLDVLLTGLRMVPFSVLWQGLAHPWFHFCRGPALGAYKVSLQIRDVSNKPMNTTLCKVETISLCNKQLESFTHGNVLHITSTIPRKFFNCARQLVSAQILLRPKAAGKGNLDIFEVMLVDEHDRNFVGDYVLRQLQQEGCAFEPGKPVWQLLMLHLAREERLAIMDVGGSDSTCFALLDPLTVHLALLSIVDKVCFSESLGCLSKDESVHPYEKSLAILSAVEESRSDTDSSWSVPVEIPRQEIGICKGAHNYDEIQPKERMIKPPLKRKPLIPLASAYHQDLNVLDHNALTSRKKRAKPSCSPKPEDNLQGAGNMILEELYLRSSKRSKILKVLSCWMKQMKQDLDLVSFSHVHLLSASAGRYSHVISDVGPDNPLTGNPNLQCREEYKGVAVAPHIANPSSGDCQPLNNVPDMRRVDGLDCQPLDDSAVQDTISLPLLAKSASSKGLCHDKEAAACENLALDDANAFIASLDQKIVDCLSSPEIDLHCFSQRVVVDAQSALSVLLSRGPLSEDHCQNLNTLTELASEANIVDKMIQILLQNPKKLASKYKKCRLATSQITESELEVSHHMYGSEEKVREHELQILFRMEIISLMLEPSGNQVVSTLVNEICRLLESIQFNLPGGVLEGESLLDFSNNVIKERYKERLPTIVDDIYMIMEFNGHDDVSEVEELEPSKAESELIPSGSDAHDSWGVEEDSFSNSDNPYTSSSQGKWKDHSRDLSLQRALFRERTRCVGRAPADQKLKQAEAKRERAKRFLHFASSSRDLLRVTVTPKISVCIKRHPKIHGGSTRSKPSKPKKASENEVILQTPFSSAKQRSEKPPLAVKKQLLS